MPVTDIDELPFDELVPHWRRQMLRTDPIDEDKARRAIESLTVAVTGRAPRAVFFVSSPVAAQLAARIVKVDLVKEGLDRLLLGKARRLRSDRPDWSPESQRLTLLEETVARSHRSSLDAAAFLLLLRLAEQELDDPGSSAARSRATWDILHEQAARQPFEQGLGLLRRNGKCPPQASRRLPIKEWRPVNELYGLYAGARAAQRPDSGNRSRVMPASLQQAIADVLEETGLFWLFPEVAIVVDRPEVLRVNGEGALHSEIGPAVSFRDGEALYAVRGVAIPDRIFEHPESITVDEIDREGNTEVRRVMIDRMGRQRYLELGGARRVHEDETGVLWRRWGAVERRVPGRHRPILSHTRALAYVEVVNGTAEPDGTFKRYFLRVPPNMQTAREAVAWTYGLSEAEYVPARRT